MKKLTVLILTVSILMLSVVPVYADFSATDSVNLTAIKNAVTSGGSLHSLISSIQSTLSTSGNFYGLVNSIKTVLTSTSSGSLLSYLSSINSQLTTTTNNSTLRYFIQSINSSLVYDGDSVARYASRIWIQMPTLATQSAIATHVDNIYHLLATTGVIPQQLLDDVSNIDTSVTSMLTPLSSINSNVSSIEDTASLFYISTYGGGGRIPLATISWTDLSSSSSTKGYLTSWLSSAYTAVQEPLARLAFVHASDEEIRIRENASTAQTEFDENFLSDNGLGKIPDSSYGDIAGLSSQFTSAFTTGANPSAIFNVFDSTNWGWFSQDTANSLDTTPRTRSSSNFPTPNLDAQIEAIYSLLGGD